MQSTSGASRTVWLTLSSARSSCAVHVVFVRHLRPDQATASAAPRTRDAPRSSFFTDCWTAMPFCRTLVWNPPADCALIGENRTTGVVFDDVADLPERFPDFFDGTLSSA